MKTMLVTLTLVAATAASAAAAAAAIEPARDVAALLKAVDRYRTGGAIDNLQVETQVTVFNRDGTPDKERRYTVFAQARHKSLVLMRSPAEAGQKVLMLGDDFWLLLPGSQRPLRITPAQKLLGDAAIGDIATLSWAEDYTGTLVGEERCAPAGAVAAAAPTAPTAPAAPAAPTAPTASAPSAAAPTSVPCLHLTLQSARKGLSYARIELWLGARKHEPLLAELYVQSEKLAKRASFVMDRAAAPTRVDEMVLSDRLGAHKETRVRYLSRQPKQVPEAWLNPMFLARNPALE
ncbi:MAG: outer membrane lipoprotein-sorting protein [Rubrivivax sp.]|nr:outer membrane lipoprotein-sorting protein [Rubrivivax sp.]